MGIGVDVGASAGAGAGNAPKPCRSSGPSSRPSLDPPKCSFSARYENILDTSLAFRLFNHRQPTKMYYVTPLQQDEDAKEYIRSLKSATGGQDQPPAAVRMDL